MKMPVEEENNLRIELSRIVELYLGMDYPVKGKVDLIMDELQTLLPQDNPNKQEIAIAKEIALHHNLFEE